MAIIHVHVGGGCEAIEREDGNEIEDLNIHRHLCQKRDEKEVRLPGGVVKRLCREHAEKFESRWG